MDEIGMLNFNTVSRGYSMSRNTGLIAAGNKKESFISCEGRKSDGF